MNYFPTIGLEIHAELKTRTKMFCASKNNPDETRPNVNVCPVCLAHPGTLPVINREAVAHVQKVGVAVGGELADYTEFDRKNYFYPDLPKGYQISQYEYPLVSGGELLGIALTRIHLEEDTASSVHDEKKGMTLIDFNRAGVPLMELVTEPVMHSAKEAGAFARELQLLMWYLDVSEANMEKGELRIEANVSVAHSNDKLIPANKTRIVLKDESYKLMGLLFKIHNELGTTYKEKNYQDAIAAVLEKQHIPYEREKPFGVMMDGEKVSDFYADFLVDRSILLEVKARKEGISGENIRQTLRYIKSANTPLGIIVNFRKQQLEYKRIVNPTFDKNSVSFGVHSSTKLGTKVEVKNLNSFNAMERAVAYEIKRQTELLERGEKVVQETRGWDEAKQATFSQRVKEGSADYRYFPDPDLPSLKLSEQSNYSESALKKSLPELPWERRARYLSLGLKPEDAELFVRQTAIGNFMDELSSAYKGDPRSLQLAANYIANDLMNIIRLREASTRQARDTSKRDSGEQSDIPSSRMNETSIGISAVDFKSIIDMLLASKISSRSAKDMIAVFAAGEKEEPMHYAEHHGLFQTATEDDLSRLIEKVIAEHPAVVEDYRRGKEPALEYLVGQAMRVLRGAADAAALREKMKKTIRK